MVNRRILETYPRRTGGGEGEGWRPNRVDRMEQDVLRAALATGECDAMTDAEWDAYVRKRVRGRLGAVR